MCDLAGTHLKSCRKKIKGGQSFQHHEKENKLFLISLITSNIVRQFDLSRTQNFQRIIARLILLVFKIHVFKKGVFLKENLFFDMI